MTNEISLVNSVVREIKLTLSNNVRSLWLSRIGEKKVVMNESNTFALYTQTIQAGSQLW